MPQCPICNTGVWVGECNCPTCGNYLPHPEEGEHFCPQCSIRVAPQQEICPRCKAALSEIAEIPPPTWATGRRPLFKGPGIFIGTGLVIVALLLAILFTKSPGPPEQMVTPSPQIPADLKQTPAVPSHPPAETPAETAPAAPAAQAAAVPEPTAPAASQVTAPIPAPSRYFVNIHSVKLRDGPSMSASQIAILNFHDEVELLETSGNWGKMRDKGRGIVGWSYLRYFEPVAADSP